MVEETENLVLSLLRDIRKEQTEQRSLLLGTVDHMRSMDGEMRRMDEDMRRMDEDMRRMEQRLETRISAVRDDLEL